MRVAVIGGGLFGCTTATYLARAGHEVHLFESNRNLMQGATSCCFYRLHRGYHYPRSPETGLECLAAEASFRAEYGECVIDGGEQFYIIGKDSKVSSAEFEMFMEVLGLPYERCDHPLIGNSYRVSEPRIEGMALALLVRRKVEDSGVDVHLNTCVDKSLGGFDRVVVAAYAQTNCVMAALGLPKQEYKFQVVEKPIVRLPQGFANTSVVVMDLCCIDPHQMTERHAIGHVSETIHSGNVGLNPVIPESIRPLIGRGKIGHHENESGESRIQQVVDSVARTLPRVCPMSYIGSMYCVRAVLAGQEQTDARPTIVEQVNDQVIRIFSGKLGTAVSAANEVVSMLKMEKPMQAVA